eukprot:1195401-Prorocentrum_minimum.AAC.1
MGGCNARAQLADVRRAAAVPVKHVKSDSNGANCVSCNCVTLADVRRAAAVPVKHVESDSNGANCVSCNCVTV